MTPPRSASFQIWQLGILAGAGFFVFPGPVLAAPGKSAGKAAHPSGWSIPSGRAPAVSYGEFADAWATSRPAAPDLLLTKDDDRRARAFAFFSQAVLAEDNSDTDAALAGYRHTIDLDPANTQIAVKVASMLLQREDPSTAIQILKDAVKAAPAEALPLVYLSHIYLSDLKKPDLALKYADQALAADGNCFPAYGAVFEVLATGNQGAKAELVLQRALKATSVDPQFWLQLGALWVGVHFKGAEPDSPAALAEANALYRKAAALGKNNATVQAKAGNYFVESGQVKDSVSFLLAAIALKPDSDDPALGSVKEKLFKALQASGDRAQAIKVLEQITRDNPLNLDQFELLGELYEENGDLAKALDNYKRSTLLEGSKPENHIMLAQMQMRLKQFDDAVETAKSARARFPDEPRTHFLLALALGQAKRHTDAMAAFAEAKSEFETNGHEEFLNAAFYFRYGAEAEQAGLIDKSEELLKKSIELDPASSAQACNYLGYMWVDRGLNLDEGGEMIKKAVADEPDNGAFLDSLGWYYFKKGEFEEALKHLLRAVEQFKADDPDDATIYDHLADIYQKLGKTDEAVRYWQKALAQHGEDLDAGKVQEKLDAARQKITAATPAPEVKPP